MTMTSKVRKLESNLHGLAKLIFSRLFAPLRAIFPSSRHHLFPCSNVLTFLLSNIRKKSNTYRTPRSNIHSQTT